MPEWHQVRRLLVAFLGEGDAARGLLPALRRLTVALPGRHLGWLGVPGAIPADSRFPAFDSVVLYNPGEARVDDNPWSERSLVERVQREAYDGAIVFTRPGESPWLAAYVCYLAGVPLRAGQSDEFGGGVLSHAYKPPADGEDRHLALLEALGLAMRNETLEMRSEK